MTEDFFDPDCLLSSLDLSTEHKILDLKNKIEASVVIWKRKINAKDTKSSWGSGVSMEKRELLEDRAETILLILKHRFPGIPQSDLDINKIQYNRVKEFLFLHLFIFIFLFFFFKFICFLILLQDVGHAILESYSRIIESLAFTVLSRIEDVMRADAEARNSANAEQKRQAVKEQPKEESETLSSGGTPSSKTLLDFMGWGLDQGEKDSKDLDDDVSVKPLKQPDNVITNKKISYIERLENLGGIRSPTARH